MSAASDRTLTDPQVAAMAASAGTNEVEVTGPMGPLPPYPEIEIPLLSSTPIAALPLRFCKMDVVEPSPSTPQVNNQKRQRNGEWTVVPDRKSLKMRNMDWLPLDWTVRKKDRLNGETAGRSDHEFVAPNGIRCRSKKEFLAYRDHRIFPKATSNALRRKLSGNVFETHHQNNEDAEKIEDEQKDEEQQKEDEQKEEEKVEQEAPASGAEQIKGWL